MSQYQLCSRQRPRHRKEAANFRFPLWYLRRQVRSIQRFQIGLPQWRERLVQFGPSGGWELHKQRSRTSVHLSTNTTSVLYVHRSPMDHIDLDISRHLPEMIAGMPNPTKRRKRARNLQGQVQLSTMPGLHSVTSHPLLQFSLNPWHKPVNWPNQAQSEAICSQRTERQGQSRLWHSVTEKAAVDMSTGEFCLVSPNWVQYMPSYPCNPGGARDNLNFRRNGTSLPSSNCQFWTQNLPGSSPFLFCQETTWRLKDGLGQGSTAWYADVGDVLIWQMQSVSPVSVKLQVHRIHWYLLMFIDVDCFSLLFILLHSPLLPWSFSQFKRLDPLRILETQMMLKLPNCCWMLCLHCLFRTCFARFVCFACSARDSDNTDVLSPADPKSVKLIKQRPGVTKSKVAKWSRGDQVTKKWSRSGQKVAKWWRNLTWFDIEMLDQQLPGAFWGPGSGASRNSVPSTPEVQNPPGAADPMAWHFTRIITNL